MTHSSGYFGPLSTTWRLYREPAILLGGARALLLQIAHPAVADGVARYSNFRQDALGRGLRTFQAMATLYFGDRQQADGVARRLFRLHGAIQGTYVDASGRQQAYEANQPDLLLWVLATLTDTAVRVFEQVPPADLPADWRERFYAESRVAAELLGIPPEQYPADWAAHERYFQDMLHSPLLGSAPVCAELARAITHHRLSWPPLVYALTARWMPPALLARLGLPAHPRYERAQTRLFALARAHMRLVPGTLRYNPAYHQAMRRVEPGRHAMGGFYNWLGRWGKVPLGL